jgi:hypothetical protein
MAVEAANAKEQRRRRTSGGTADLDELPSSSTLMGKAKRAIQTENGAADLQTKPKMPLNPLKNIETKSQVQRGVPKGFHGGSFITAEALAKAGIANDQQAQQAPSPAPQQQQHPTAEGPSSPSVTDTSAKAPAPPTHRRRSSASSAGSVSPPSDRLAANGPAPHVPKVKPKPRVPSPTPETSSAATAPTLATPDTTPLRSTVAAGRSASPPAAPLAIATQLLAAFDGDFSKAVECLLTAHKFA